ncbi:hypothetical protein [Caballeronia sp. GAWG2-1]|uniref:hypothetical protein n=1 Tax=Caballeronia sp. GAWG2-1 TaxID=2921744 RepID=UPI0020298FAA|nr:hypothetical protein [Caballeronia sp. GAWG2-1]
MEKDYWVVNDRNFVAQTQLLRDLYAFLLFNGKELQSKKVPSGFISGVKYVTYGTFGKRPNADQWYTLDRSLEVLFSKLDTPLRRRFLFGQFPPWIPKMAYWCLALVVTCFIASVVMSMLGVAAAVSFIPYVVYLTAMGALGATAFVAMNLLSVQDDLTFDITSSRLLGVRVIVGALFGLMFSLPFAWQVFLSFGDWIANAKHSGLARDAPTSLFQDPSEWNQALRLLVPFVLGFSTSVVILILNRLVEGIRTLFGAQAAPENAALVGTQRGAPDAGGSGDGDAPKRTEKYAAPKRALRRTGVSGLRTKHPNLASQSNYRPSN